MALPFESEPPPQRGLALSMADRIVRMTAPNGGRLTYHGTNSYLLATPNGYIVIDPGPDDPAHRAALMRHGGGNIIAILLTHGHGDHADGIAALKAATSAATYAHAGSIAVNFKPDVSVADEQEVFGLRAIHTPGHAPDHLCFYRSDGTLFSGDHVMTWSTTAVSPPRGRIADYCNSLERLLALDVTCLLPGHGPPSHQPRALIQALLTHRQNREQEVFRRVQIGDRTPHDIANCLYGSTESQLRGPAERTVWAYLESLAEKGLIRQQNDEWLPA